jgi:acyl-CoA reductase-like NAD-dependent aldehyde dehydrogenase
MRSASCTSRRSGTEAHLPFGGVKQTGNGHREGGWEVYEFYSETKVCYLDYSVSSSARRSTTTRRAPC